MLLILKVALIHDAEEGFPCYHLAVPLFPFPGQHPRMGLTGTNSLTRQLSQHQESFRTYTSTYPCSPCSRFIRRRTPPKTNTARRRASVSCLALLVSCRHGGTEPKLLLSLRIWRLLWLCYVPCLRLLPSVSSRVVSLHHRRWL